MTLSLNANIFNNRFKGIVNDTLINLSVNSGNFNGAIQTKLGKGWDAELNGFYNTRGVDGVMVFKSMGMFTVAVSKSVLKNQGKITSTTAILLNSSVSMVRPVILPLMPLSTADGKTVS